jgi:predicted SnoaL-like aldol condensation-catalyzing enzyme
MSNEEGMRLALKRIQYKKNDPISKPHYTRRYPMSTEQNKAVVRRFVEEVLTSADTSLVDELLAPNYVNHMVPGGREGFKQFRLMLGSAFPDLTMEIRIERLLAEGDYVMIRASAYLSNAGVEATGSGLGEYRLANGKIVEDWPLSGVADLLQQIGMTLPVG